jgi:hypothetical protein
MTAPGAKFFSARAMISFDSATAFFCHSGSPKMYLQQAMHAVYEFAINWSACECASPCLLKARHNAVVPLQQAGHVPAAVYTATFWGACPSIMFASGTLVMQRRMIISTPNNASCRRIGLTVRSPAPAVLAAPSTPWGPAPAAASDSTTQHNVTLRHSRNP